MVWSNCYWFHFELVYLTISSPSTLPQVVFSVGCALGPSCLTIAHCVLPLVSPYFIVQQVEVVVCGCLDLVGFAFGIRSSVVTPWLVLQIDVML